MTVSVYDDRRADDRESQRVYLLPWRQLSVPQAEQVAQNYPGDDPTDYAYEVDYRGVVTGRYEPVGRSLPPFDWRGK